MLSSIIAFEHSNKNSTFVINLQSNAVKWWIFRINKYRSVLFWGKKIVLWFFFVLLLSLSEAAEKSITIFILKSSCYCNISCLIMMICFVLRSFGFIYSSILDKCKYENTSQLPIHRVQWNCFFYLSDTSKEITFKSYTLSWFIDADDLWHR